MGVEGGRRGEGVGFGGVKCWGGGGRVGVDGSGGGAYGGKGVGFVGEKRIVPNQKNAIKKEE